MRKRTTVGARSSEARTLAASRSNQPVTFRYASVGSIEKSPAMMTGLPKSARTEIPTRSMDATRPGRSSGTVTSRNTREFEAPRLLAACSRLPGMERRTLASVRYASGKKVNVWTSQRPFQP